MIEISNNFKAQKGEWGWTLYEEQEGLTEKGKPRPPKLSYHATFEQCCRYVMNNELSSCESLQEVMEHMDLTIVAMGRLEELSRPG